MSSGVRSGPTNRTENGEASLPWRSTSMLSPMAEESPQGHSGSSRNPFESLTDASEPPPRHHSFTKKLFGMNDDGNGPPLLRNRSSSFRRRSSHGFIGDSSLFPHQQHAGAKDKEGHTIGPRPGAMPRPIGGQEKLGTFSGVFVPTSLNVLSILMFLRFGLILGQGGLLGMMGMLIVSYIINLVTTLSISAIATNGTVRGGGAYYLISRSLGPEFGGSIGVVFYLGLLFNTSMNAVGLIDCVTQNFGHASGNWSQWLPEGFWWQYLWGSVVLVICTAICLGGSAIFARCSNGLLAILLIATFSIPFSSFFVRPFRDPKLGIHYTGLSAQTFLGNLLPKFTRHAAGSQVRGKENFQDLFGILFPACGGIFAGASMSGDLKHPSKAIPKGTLSGLALTFIAYTLVVFAMAATVTRDSLYNDVNIVQDTNVSGILILLGEFATTFFSSLLGVIGSAKLLQAIARDNLIPGLLIFGQGTINYDEPTYAIIFTFALAQLAMFCDINQLASFVTMTYLMTFLVTNLACFLLKISSAPNFRPSFRYFNWGTAGFGFLISGASMFFVDGLYATGCVGILVIIFLIIHYTTPPKSWGDVSQSLIYHQVRKYLLRMKPGNVKFWRPQLLLFVNNPRKQYRLVQFCNSLKKGGLFVLGHVIVAHDFGKAVPEARRQQAAWTKYIDFSKVKAFVNIAISPAIEWGARNVVLGAGLGGLTPNIVIFGIYNLNEYRSNLPLIPVPSPQTPMHRQKKSGAEGSHENGFKSLHQTGNIQGGLPTDTCRTEGGVSPRDYVTILEDMLLRLQINVAIAKGFEDLEFPTPKDTNVKKYIDLWPIQMSAEIATEGGEEKQNVLTTNFDTYTLILQLGCILNTVPAWKRAYRLRVAVFVEYESDVEEERGRVKALLDNLRIKAKVLVFWLASGDVNSYQVIVNGAVSSPGKGMADDIDKVLESEEWWQDVQKLRGKRGNISASEELAGVRTLLEGAPNGSNIIGQNLKSESATENFKGIKKLLHTAQRRRSAGNFGSFGVRLGMTTHKLREDLMSHHPTYASASEESDTSDDDDESFMNFDDDESSSHSRASAASADDIRDMDSDGDLHTKRPKSSGALDRRRSDGDPTLKTSSKKTHREHHPHEKLQISNFQRPETSDSSTSPSMNQSSDPSKAERALDAKKKLDTDNQEDESKRMDNTLHVNKAEEAPATSSRPNNLTIHEPKSSASSIKSPISDAPNPPSTRPKVTRRASGAKFSSKPVPKTTVAKEEGPGPSIMFTENPESPQPRPLQSIYNRNQSSDANSTASGFPFQQSIPLSFNDLPCRAQHLIINELMQQHSGDTAVLFTTLPSPVEGTCHSEEDSVSYLSDLEVLCEGLPPVMLVHSNSMTVTMNL